MQAKCVRMHACMQVCLLASNPCKPLLACTSTPQALKTFGSDIALAFSGAEDVALIEYAHLTGRPYRVFRCGMAGYSHTCTHW